MIVDVTARQEVIPSSGKHRLSWQIANTEEGSKNRRSRRRGPWVGMPTQGPLHRLSHPDCRWILNLIVATQTIRKTVANALASNTQVALNPGSVTLSQLTAAAKSAQTNKKENRGK